jgi:hypothetical protein
MPQKNLMIDKNLLDMEYQKTITLINITAVAIATFLITLWFSSTAIETKVSFSLIGLVVSGMLLFTLLNRISSLIEKVKELK